MQTRLFSCPLDERRPRGGDSHRHRDWIRTWFNDVRILIYRRLNSRRERPRIRTNLERIFSNEVSNSLTLRFGSVLEGSGRVAVLRWTRNKKKKKGKRGIVRSVLLRKSRLFVQTRRGRVLSGDVETWYGRNEFNGINEDREERKRERDSRTSREIRCIYKWYRSIFKFLISTKSKRHPLYIDLSNFLRSHWKQILFVRT